MESNEMMIWYEMIWYDTIYDFMLRMGQQTLWYDIWCRHWTVLVLDISGREKIEAWVGQYSMRHFLPILKKKCSEHDLLPTKADHGTPKNHCTNHSFQTKVPHVQVTAYANSKSDWCKLFQKTKARIAALASKQSPWVGLAQLIIMVSKKW